MNDLHRIYSMQYELASCMLIACIKDRQVDTLEDRMSKSFKTLPCSNFSFKL